MYKNRHLSIFFYFLFSHLFHYTNEENPPPEEHEEPALAPEKLPPAETPEQSVPTVATAYANPAIKLDVATVSPSVYGV